MKSQNRKYSLLIMLAGDWIAFGCSCFRVVNLAPSKSQTKPPPDLPFNTTVGVETLRLSQVARYGAAGQWLQGLGKVLREKRVFTHVVAPYQNDVPVDLILRGQVGGEWRTHGFLNFITWFPGKVDPRVKTKIH